MPIIGKTRVVPVMVHPTGMTYYCPKCREPMKMGKFIDSEDVDGLPMDVVEDPYCEKCGIRVQWSELSSEQMLRDDG